MLVRIKKIQQVGVFDNFTTGGPVVLNEKGNITLIFGRNRSGKTTLASIFQSLGENDPTLIDRCVSIPQDTSLSKCVEIAYKIAESEEAITFSSSGWDKEDLKGKVIVFDQNFVHNNLMLGKDITRENKENLTDFILGEDGVEESDNISNRKKALRDARKQLPVFLSRLGAR